MDIHKPKPWHGWREFLKEYLIIVVGVLTALAAEQGVEWLHWRELARATETHLAAGVQPNLINAARWVMTEPCRRGRVTDLATELEKPGGQWRANPQPMPQSIPPLPRPTAVVIDAPGLLWPHVGWDAALASGALNHLPRDQLDSYAEIYRLVEVARDGQLAVQIAHSRLSPLGYDRILSEAERTAFLAQVAEVQQLQQRMINSSREILRVAHAIGIEPNAAVLARAEADERNHWGACVQQLQLPVRA
jgi:hypothetical protein